MAKDKRPQFPKYTSIKGTFSWPKVNEPDYGNEKYPVKEGQYVVNLVVPQNDKATKDFIKKLTPHYREAIEAGKQAFEGLGAQQRKKLKSLTENEFYTVELDRETEEPTGNIIFKFKMKASGVYRKGPKAGQKWTAKPNIFDAEGNLMKKPPSIWGGTEGKVAFSVRPYFVDGQGAAGISLDLNAVQIINLVSEGERSASSYGFGKEDGYSHDEDGDETEDDSGDADEKEEGDAADSSDEDDDADF